MTTAFAAEDDPYVLPMPTADSPVVLPQWIRSHANRLRATAQAHDTTALSVEALT